jgi:hypothetical protein
MANSRTAIELIKKDFDTLVMDGQDYYFKDARKSAKPGNLKLLPAFDEFLISYKDRTASIEKSLQPKAFTKNGIFNPVLIADGKVEGSWKRTVTGSSVLIEISPFSPFDENTIRRAKNAAARFGEYLGKEAVVGFTE